MHVEIHKAQDRGKSDIDWLKTRYSFSFADYYHPQRLGFGKLLVLNDDIIAPGKGFPAHSHQNMEIITIVIKGELAHQDSTGGKGVIKPGEVQVMSAGTGVRHSEFNNSKTEPVELFQTWILPKKQNIKPRYDQTKYQLKPNIPTVLASNKGIGLHIEQDAAVSLLELEKTKSITLALAKNHGAYVFVVEGDITVADENLKNRDALAITQTTSYSITATKNSKLILFDVPI